MNLLAVDESTGEKLNADTQSRLTRSSRVETPIHFNNAHHQMARVWKHPSMTVFLDADMSDERCEMLIDRLDLSWQGLPPRLQEAVNMVFFPNAPISEFAGNNYSNNAASAISGMSTVMIWPGPAQSVAAGMWVFAHEVAHLAGVDGGPPNPWEWEEAMLRDQGQDTHFSLDCDGWMPRLTLGHWVTRYAQATGLLAEDWAESVAAFVWSKANDGLLDTRVRFENVYPYRSALIQTWLTEAYINYLP